MLTTREVFKLPSLARWFSPIIATLPPRLLGEIFWHILYNLNGTPVKDIEVKRVMLRSVCKYWMNAIDSNPRLWTAIVLEDIDLWYRDSQLPLNLVERVIRHSGEEPIEISINASLQRHPHRHPIYSGLLIRQILGMLIGPQGDVLKRWKWFKFSCCDHFDVSLLGSLGLWPAPFLVGLELTCPGQFGGFIELNAPMLQYLVHRECTLFAAPPPGFHFMALVDLTLSAPLSFERALDIDFAGWLNLLRQTPRLISLRLDSTFAVDLLLPGPSEREDIIELSYLQQIIISDDGPWKLLQYLRFPALTTLKVSGALSETFCTQLMESAQCYDHLSHLKYLWFRQSIITTETRMTVEEGASFYGNFLTRLFPELDTLIIPFSIYGYSARKVLAFRKVQPPGESWRFHVFGRLQHDTRFPNRAVINGGEEVLKECFYCTRYRPCRAVEGFRQWCLEGRRLTQTDLLFPVSDSK